MKKMTPKHIMFKLCKTSNKKQESSKQPQKKKGILGTEKKCKVKQFSCWKKMWEEQQSNIFKVLEEKNPLDLEFYIVKLNFWCTKAERIYQQQTYIIRNVKGNHVLQREYQVKIWIYTKEYKTKKMVATQLNVWFFLTI